MRRVKPAMRSSRVVVAYSRLPNSASTSFPATSDSCEKAHNNSQQDRFEEGIWIGMVFKTSETLIVSPIGAFRTGSIRRKVIAERWNVPFADAFRGKPFELGRYQAPPIKRYQHMCGSEIGTRHR